MDRWAGRTALVTGSASGIGRATTAQLLTLGINVVASDLSHRVQLIDAIKEEMTDAGSGELMVVACDVSKEQDVISMFEKVKQSELKGVDICVNSAGFGDSKKLSEGHAEVWKKMLEVNVLGLSICTREALKSMRARGVDDGHIIHLCSVAGQDVSPYLPFYSATKFAVRALAEGLRQELAQDKSSIRVTTISPGPVKTEFNRNLEGDFFKEFFNIMPHLTTSDIVTAMIHALSAPKHVQVHDVLVQSIAIPQ